MESLAQLVARYPKLAPCENEIARAADLIAGVFANGGTLFACGNGGSAADADHLVGELAKGFLKKRPLNPVLAGRLREAYPDGELRPEELEEGLPAVSLHSQSALFTAFSNDVSAESAFAQALYALSKPGDVLVAFSTSGNSRNVVKAARLARVTGVSVVALTGERESALSALADIAIRVGDTETYRVQELHLPAYHWIAARIENTFYKE